MAGGVRGTTKFQIGGETTAGTAVASTTVMHGWGNNWFENARVRESFDSMDGFLGRSSGRHHDLAYTPTLPVDEHFASFEQLPYWLAAGIESVVSGVRDGTAGSGYIYTYDLVTNTRQAPKTYTIEGGDGQRSDEMEYAFVEEMTISGGSQGAWMIGGTWRGRQLTDAAFTTAQTLPTISVITFGQTTMSIDASGGTIGDTDVTDTLLAFELNIPTGHLPVFSAGGQLYFIETEQVEHEITGTLTLRHNTTGEAAWTAAEANAVQLIRLESLGKALTTAGTSHTYLTAQIDLAIQYTELPPVGEEDRINTLEMPFEVVYSSADSLRGKIVIVNNLTTLT